MFLALRGPLHLAQKGARSAPRLRPGQLAAVAVLVALWWSYARTSLGSPRNLVLAAQWSGPRWGTQAQ